eukprot:gb/GECH01013432.1/.p1 GENE.gb/GECH01013432.1/~~gb/GECH01013432.1/.p1  ORF type:complete len:647 (+),score=165.68 gb/GECH01013432.1/:1-1941(+)
MVQKEEKGNLVIEDVPEIPVSLQERTRQYQNTRVASLSGWLPKENQGMLIRTRFAETAQIHRVSKPGGSRKQLTFFNEPVSSASPCPDENVDGFIFSKDIGGNERFQLYFFDNQSGTSKMITDGQGKCGSLRWSNQGDKFAYFSTKRNNKDHDVYIGTLDSDPENHEMIIQAEGLWYATDWSLDDRKLIIKNRVSITKSYLYLLDLDKSENDENRLKRISPSPDVKEDEDVSNGIGKFDTRPGSNGIFFTSDEGSEFIKLRYYSLDTEKIDTLTSDIDWDVETVRLSNDGKYMAFTTNENGLNQLYVQDLSLPLGQFSRIDQLPTALIYGLHFHPRDSSQLGFVINSPKTPGDVYSIDLRAYFQSSKTHLTQWTESEVGGLNTNDFVVPETIEFKSFDDRKIPSFYYKPKTPGPHPVVIHIHGGPEGQSLPLFVPLFQFLLKELGCAVLDPNVRGSDGYGKTYLKLDNDYKREDSVKDIGALLDWINEQDDLDSSRIAVFGGSYGGYMVLASLIHYGHRLACGAEIVGISNFVTFLENTESYRQDLRRVEYGDERDPKMREFLNKISPLTSAHQIEQPMLIAQGANDPRVPASESKQIVSAIRDNGKSVWYVLAKDEGHGFRKRSNRDYFQNALVLFFKQFLLKKD